MSLLADCVLETLRVFGRVPLTTREMNDELGRPDTVPSYTVMSRCLRRLHREGRLERTQAEGYDCKRQPYLYRLKEGK